MRKYALVFVSLCATAYAQRGTGDWTAGGYDAQRSSWVRGDGKISLATMQEGGFQLLWKLKTSAVARRGHGLTPPALLDFYIGYRGFRALSFGGGGNNTVTAIDTDMGRLEWEKKFAAAMPASGSPGCPGAMVSTVARPGGIDYPPVVFGRVGRNTPAKSGVGEPFEGAVTIRASAPAPAPPPPPKPAPARARRAVEDPSPFAARIQWVHAIATDGKLHSMYASNGEEPNEPIPFLPAGARAHGLIVFENTAYVATSNGCGGVENGLWALDLTTRKVSHWKSGGKGVAGTAGPAVSPDGTIYVAGGAGQLVALEAGTLKEKGSYRAPGQEFATSPVVFDHHGKTLVAVATADGRIHVVDGADVAGQTPLAKSAPFFARGFVPGALTSWLDAAGSRWILAAAGGPLPEAVRFPNSNGEVKRGAIAAWKLVDRAGELSLVPGWLSQDMQSPLPPIVVNGVVFAVAGGSATAPAVLYALDPFSGRELWNSGKAIGSFVGAGGGLAAGGGRIFVGTVDGTQYAFGFKLEI